MTHHEETNGQTVASLKRVKDMLQFNVPAKYAAPIILSLLGVSGYAYKDSLIPASPSRVSRAWVEGVDRHIEDSKAGYAQLNAQSAAIGDIQAEAKATRQEAQATREATAANSAAIQNLTRSVEQLTLRIDRLLEAERSR